MANRRRALRPSVRRAAIHELIEKRGRATVEDLAERHGASVETVRRDLNALAEAGRVRKVHGGAVRAGVAEEGSFDERLARNARAKREIAEKLVGLVRPGQTIMIDTGSTTLICAEALARVPGLTVITNSTRIAHVFAAAGNGARTVLLGGDYRAGDAQTVGPRTCAEIARLRPDLVVLAISALDSAGAYNVSEEEAEVARAMVESAGALALVADRTKLDRTATYQICGLDRIGCLVLDAEPEPALKGALTAAGVDLV